MPYFKSSAGNVYYEDVGTGTPLVFIHGRTLDLRMWNPQIAYFKSQYRCVSYDLNGFGKSQIPSEQYSRAETLKEILDFLNINSATLIGLSLGSYVALEFVLSFPRYVRALVLMSSAVPGTIFSEEFMHDWNVVAHAGENGDLNTAKKAWIECQAFRSLKLTNPSNYNLFLSMIADYSGWDIQHSQPRSRTLVEDAFKRFSEIVSPTLIMYGEKDYTDFVINSQKLHQGIANSVLYEIPQSSHMVNLEYPDLVNSYIQQFLQQHN